ncbi:formimidoylglutamase [Corynebacterium minutissimum]|uniref:Formimidoylglutamase n=1 Tax=Corynebacterium minutissimum TaxID=38301 RepID=A0A2X4REE1_9CORY|nr:formimidoylglutamase [Corynebacterium minutissimum]KHO29611.1 formimidoylglutamase [Corynebacterium minutissimum]MCG7229523.1 formimidoylglutamase [Corynebacterium minutissimum]MCG7238686.1 formimidoylglutamase [Corynebacterium minutissimum]QPS58678.1 formimidoylglutamase [Corynebacterium minutissimum]QQA80532.1 formimidoylglutamase [Corynebacterium minutissimum]
MNSVDAPAYSPASEWSGRSDGPGPEHARWHSVVRPLDVDNPQAQPGVALLGFASDEGVERNHGRPGAAAGPEALRNALGSLAVHHEHALYDAGTITTQSTDLEGAHERLSTSVEALSNAGHLPIILGGGHETAFGSHRGAFHAQGPLKIINLDAHFDLRTADVPTSGTPFKQISELVGREDFDYSVLGISRPNNTTVLFDEAADLGVTITLDEELLAMNLQQVRAHTEHLCAGEAPIHLSIDLDVLPAAQAPGVSAPAGLGVDLPIIRELAVAIAATGRLALVDVVELNPSFDLDNRTAKLAARLIDDIVTAHFSAVSA